MHIRGVNHTNLGVDALDGGSLFREVALLQTLIIFSNKNSI